jgi:hypothetical protein
MGSIILKSLVLASSLILALPPGWCEFVSLPTISSSDEAPKKHHGGCCDLCDCPDREKPAPEPPQPASPSRCCCYELDWLKPPLPVSAEADHAPVAFISLADALGVAPRMSVDPDLAIRVLSPPHCILHCVWVC